MIGYVYWGRNAPTDTVSITHPDRDGLLSDIADHMVAKRGFTLATLNLDHCVKLRSNTAFRAAYQAHSHVVADGNPIVWLSRMAGRPVSLIPGSELITPLATLAAQKDVPVALFGSTPETLEATADALQAEHPGLRIAAKISPPFGFDPTGPVADEMIEKLRASGARMCFLALGAPKQEVFAMRAAAALPDCGFASIGAGLDFIAGSQQRAPWLVRRLAAEWLWRLVGNPSRMFKRYAACFAILPDLTLTARSQRGQ